MFVVMNGMTSAGGTLSLPASTGPNESSRITHAGRDPKPTCKVTSPSAPTKAARRWRARYEPRGRRRRRCRAAGISFKEARRRCCAAVGGERMRSESSARIRSPSL